MFPESERREVAQLLVAECGDNLPFADTLGESGIERIRFAVLKIGAGSIERLRQAVALAQCDWRDALVDAGFGDDPEVHLQWLSDAP